MPAACLLQMQSGEGWGGNLQRTILSCQQRGFARAMQARSKTWVTSAAMPAACQLKNEALRLGMHAGRPALFTTELGTHCIGATFVLQRLVGLLQQLDNAFNVCFGWGCWPWAEFVPPGAEGSQDGMQLGTHMVQQSKGILRHHETDQIRHSCIRQACMTCRLHVQPGLLEGGKAS